MGTNIQWNQIELPEGLSTASWPVLIYTAPEVVEDAHFKRVLDAMAEIRALNEPYAMVLDLRFNKGITAHQRKMITSSMRDREAQSRQITRGLAMVFSSKLMATLLTAILWVNKPPYQTRVVANLDEAIAWARENVRGQSRKVS